MEGGSDGPGFRFSSAGGATRTGARVLAPGQPPAMIETSFELATLLEAECLGYEDDLDASCRVVVDDQCLCEQASGVAGVLHTRVFLGQAVFAYAAEAFVEVGDEFLVADDEDHVPAGVGVRAELAARAGADDDLAIVGDRVRAADD